MKLSLILFFEALIKTTDSLPTGLYFKPYFPDSSLVMSSVQTPFFKYSIILTSGKIKQVSQLNTQK